MAGTTFSRLEFFCRGCKKIPEAKITLQTLKRRFDCWNGFLESEMLF